MNFKIVFGLLAASVALSFAGIPVERYLFAVGANNGGKDRPLLRYAESDAESFAKVLVEMGGVQKGNRVLLREPSVEAVKQGLEKLDKALSQKSDSKKEVLFYYSGHADERGLRIGKELYAWADLRKRIDALHADVKISVIDACGSGAITRVKGGTAVPAFMVDASSDMKGYAFITSSTQEESSQESDRLQGSFFTHSLVSGLRGAGDLSGDGKVTLSEAYQFAFNETLQKTQATLGGAQHPSRDMNLAGTGDIVMTDVHGTAAGLVLDENMEGRIFIRDASGSLVAELQKHRGRAMELGLPAGKYSVQVERPKQVSGSSFTLENGKRLALNTDKLTPIDLEKTVSRGSTKDSLRNKKWRTTFNLIDTDKEPRRGIQIGFIGTETDREMSGGQVSLLLNKADGDFFGGQVSIGANYAKTLDGAQVSTVANVSDTAEGVQISTVANIAKSLNGAQISSTVNIVTQTSNGAQIGTINVAADTLKHGAQIGIVNVAKAAPAQISIMNIAKTADVQISVMNIAKTAPVQISTMNIADSVKTSQISLLNIARQANGRQIGLINICAHCDETPIGLISIVGNGIWNASVLIDETGSVIGKVRFGTPWFYTSLETSRAFKDGKPFQEFEDQMRTGYGIGTQFGKLGTHFDLEYTFLESRETWSPSRIGSLYNTDDEDGNFFHRVRFGATYKLLPGLGICGGISANVVTEGLDDHVHESPRGDWHADWHIAGRDVRAWPGFYAGVTVGKF